MRSFPYMEKLLNMKVDEGSVGRFYAALVEWEKVVGNEV
jgi:hypothetical protein